MRNINYLGWELGIEFEIAIIYTDGGELNFDISFLSKH